ncbi:MAG TPA: hypothetical protein VM782_18815, partial [Stellaceae bacterium]|nr:hypothetical protein [Stellaceae bacterium]
TVAGTLVDAGTFTNAGTITGAGRFIVDPAPFTNSGYTGVRVALDTGSELSNTSTGTIKVAGTAVSGTSAGAVYVSNTGIIEATGTGSTAIVLGGGGTVTNGATNATGALVSGYSYGIRAINKKATIANYGTITGTNGAAVYLSAGGSIANTGSAARLYGPGGLFVNGNGTVSNSSGAHITGSQYGIEMVGAAGTIVNAGTITGTAYSGIFLSIGGNVSNTDTAALISGGNYGIRVISRFPFGALTLNNAGTITGGIGVYVFTTAGQHSTIINSGTIAGGTLSDAVRFGGFGGDGLVVVDPGAVFVGRVDGSGASSTLELASTASAGTITGIGTSFANFGTIKVDPGAQWTFTGTDTIASGVTLTDLGTLTNAGTLTGAGKFVVDPTTFTNPGYTGIQVDLAAGSGLSNTSTGTIKVAGTAVYGYGAPATVVNAGTIEGSGTGGIAVDLSAGGAVTNSGTGALISGDAVGVALFAAGTVINTGTITTTGTDGINVGGPILTNDGVALDGGGSVGNAGTAALIEGAKYGVFVNGASGTVSNIGTIEVSSATG